MTEAITAHRAPVLIYYAAQFCHARAVSNWRGAQKPTREDYEHLASVLGREPEQDESVRFREVFQQAHDDWSLW